MDILVNFIVDPVWNVIVFPILPCDYFINVVNAVLSFLDGLKTSSLIQPILDGLLNTVITITMDAKSLLFLLLPIIPDLKTEVLSSSSLNPANIIIAGTNKLFYAYVFDVLSNILSAGAEYLFTLYRPSGGTLTLTLTNTAEIGGELICDLLSVFFSGIAWQLNAQFASAYGVDQFSQLTNNYITYFLNVLGVFSLDIGFIAKYIWADSISLYTFFIALGASLQIIGNLYYIGVTFKNKWNSGVSFFGFMATVSSMAYYFKMLLDSLGNLRLRIDSNYIYEIGYGPLSNVLQLLGTTLSSKQYRIGTDGSESFKEILYSCLENLGIITIEYITSYLDFIVTYY